MKASISNLEGGKHHLHATQPVSQQTSQHTAGAHFNNMD